MNPLNNPTDPRYWCIYTKPGDHTTVSHVAVVAKKDHLNPDEAEYNARAICEVPEMMEILEELAEKEGMLYLFPMSVQKLVKKSVEIINRINE